MKKLIVLASLFFVACTHTDTVLLKGSAGLIGNNGYSLVSQNREASSLECSNGGSAVDVYLDLDRSGVVSEGDELQSGLVACTGAVGPQGSVTWNMTAYSIGTGDCYVIAPGLSVKKQSNVSLRLYANESCTSPAMETLDEHDEVYVIDGMVLLKQGMSVSMVLRKLVLY